MSIKGSFIRFIIVDIPLVVVLLFAFHTWDQKTLTIQSPFDERIQEANAYLKNGDFNTGADLLEKALIADPSQNSLHLRLGVLYDDYLLEKNKAAYHYQLYLNAVPDTQLQNKIKEWIGNAKKDIQEPVEITLKNPSVKEPLAVSAQDIQDMQHKYEQLKIHTDKLEKLLFDQEKQLESMDVLKQQLVLSKEDYKKILQEFSLEKKRVEALHSELEERKKRESDLERRLQIFGTSYEEGVGRKEIEMDSLRTQNVQMKDEIEKIKKHNNDVLQENNQLRMKIFSLERALEKSQEDFQHKNMEMSQQIVSQREQIKDNEEQKHSLSVKIQELETENTHYKDYLQEYRTSLQSKVSQNSKLRNMIKELEQQNQQLLSRIAVLSQLPDQVKSVASNEPRVITKRTQTPEKEKQVTSRDPEVIIKQKMDTYRVKKGESLRAIAGYDFVYGNREKWVDIYEANRNKIPNPNHLVPGQVLDIPRD